MGFEPILTRNVGHPEALTVAGYRERGGYEGLAKGLEMEPEEITEEVKASGLRGRGGAGFPTGVKWGFIPADHPGPRYLVCNADESEPGTFKDRLLMEHDPHQLIEGCLLCCYAVGAETTYIYIRGEYTEAADILEEAIVDAYREGILGESVLGSDFRHDMLVHRGAGAYICGEETGMLESLEGKRGQPRPKPPFPAVIGAFDKPTVINNVETLACVPHILTRGAEWFSSIGTNEKNTGPKLYALSGLVKRPATYELPIGVTLDELVETAGGMYQGRQLKAFIPGGASAAILPATKSSIPLDFDSCAVAGSMLGSAAVMVLDETVCLIRTALRLAKFFAHESCGQCTPCREGTHWLDLLFARIEKGTVRPTDPEPAELILRITKNMTGTALCALADAAVGPARSVIENFREEVEEHLRVGGCPLPERPYFGNGSQGATD